MLNMFSRMVHLLIFLRQGNLQEAKEELVELWRNVSLLMEIFLMKLLSQPQTLIDDFQMVVDIQRRQLIKVKFILLLRDGNLPSHITS